MEENLHKIVWRFRVVDPNTGRRHRSKRARTLQHQKLFDELAMEAEQIAEGLQNDLRGPDENAHVWVVSKLPAERRDGTYEWYPKFYGRTNQEAVKRGSETPLGEEYEAEIARRCRAALNKFLEITDVEQRK